MCTTMHDLRNRMPTAAGNARGRDLLGTQGSDLLKCACDAQLLGCAGHMDGHIVTDLCNNKFTVRRNRHKKTLHTLPVGN